MKTAKILGVAVALMLSACGEDLDLQSVCEHMGSTYASFEQKKCEGSYYLVLLEQAAGDQCEQKLADCSSEVDLEAIERHLDCMDEIAACVSGSEDAFSDAYTACVPVISMACTQSFADQS